MAVPPAPGTSQSSLGKLDICEPQHFIQILYFTVQTESRVPSSWKHAGGKSSYLPPKEIEMEADLLKEFDCMVSRRREWGLEGAIFPGN